MHSDPITIKGVHEPVAQQVPEEPDHLRLLRAKVASNMTNQIHKSTLRGRRRWQHNIHAG